VRGFEYYRAVPQDAIQNQSYSKTKLTMPVIAVGAGYIPASGGNVTINYALYGMQKLTQNVLALRFLYQDTEFQKSRQTL
jgi:hypothetical protein